MKALTQLSISAAVMAGSLINVQAAPLVTLDENAAISLKATSSLSYEDNLFRTRANKANDLVFSFKPGLELTIGDAAASAKLYIANEWKWYDDIQGLDNNYVDINLNSRYNSGVFLGTLSAGYRESASNLDDSDIINDQGRLIERESSHVRANGRYSISQLTKIGVGVEFDRMSYREPGYAGYDSWAFPVTGYYSISSNLDAVAGYRFRQVETDSAGLFDYRDHYFFVGLVGELFNPLWVANVNVGYQTRKFRDFDIDTSAPSYEAGIRYQASELTAVNLSLKQDFQTSAQNGTSYRRTALSLGASHRFAPMWTADASATYAMSNYYNFNREEDQIYLTGGVSYSPNEFWSFRASYRYETVDGKSAISNDWTANVITVSASLRY